MEFRYAVRFPTSSTYRSRLKGLGRADLGKAVWRIIGEGDLPDGSRYHRLSSLYWLSDSDIDQDAPLDLTAQFSFTSARAIEAFRKALKAEVDVRFGRDPRIAVSDTWHPFNASFGVFGTRSMAHELIGVDALHKANARGQGVNVVLVDMGVEANWVRATRRRFGATGDFLKQQVHGWSRYDPKWDEKAKKWIRNPLESGQVAGRTLSEHGAMVARCILSIAPEARIWDVPLLGDADNPPGLSTATALLNRIRAFKEDGDGRFWWEEDPKDTPKNKLEELRAKFRDKPWVVVNAWGVVDTGMLPANDWKDDSGEYGDHPDHFLVNDAPEMENEGIDVLFCATNCGEPGPDTRCAAENCGPGCGIMGVNAHPSVLTVGAVRADGVPIAQSSQGPGRLARKWAELLAENKPLSYPALAAFEKPDLCAPSHFCEDDDITETSRGTSAAVAVAAGVMAALRSVDGAAALSPAEMRSVLRQSAMKSPGQFGWDPRLGYGIINAAEALLELKKHPKFPQPTA